MLAVSLLPMLTSSIGLLQYLYATLHTVKTIQQVRQTLNGSNYFASTPIDE